MKGKVAIITGASSGIGLATAFELAGRGASVVMAARSIEKLNEYKDAVEKLGGGVLIVKTDVSVEEECRNLIQKTIETFGRIDILVNNAGISMRAAFEHLDLVVMKKLMDTNFWGTVYCTKYALPYLLESKGSVVGVSSIAGFAPLPGRTGYSASKSAMHGFLQTLRVETLKKGLHVMIIAPGFTASNIRKTALVADGTQQGDTPRAEEKMMTAEEVACHLADGMLDRKKTIILTRKGKLTAFMYKLFPTFTEKQIFKHMSKEPDSPF
ncbi:MAG: short chain dehydrogenase [Bacteroidetes bacterium HGW-Bacteroidetes-21]|jgi:short-subunit dehydrogenase|nr:MAG: short chain dehydrogenase [Bacteroidetes bacterium HGW-Bacteroidetes-21]